MGPGLEKIRAGGNIEGRSDAVSNACLNFGNYSADCGPFGFESIEIPCGPQLVQSEFN